MTTTTEIADAIRDVTAAMHTALDEGRRSTRIDAWDLVEALLAIADHLDPPVPAGDDEPDPVCPSCGAHGPGRVVWNDDELLSVCGNCDAEFPPAD